MRFDTTKKLSLLLQQCFQVLKESCAHGGRQISDEGILMSHLQPEDSSEVQMVGGLIQ